MEGLNTPTLLPREPLDGALGAPNPSTCQGHSWEGVKGPESLFPELQGAEGRM